MKSIDRNLPGNTAKNILPWAFVAALPVLAIGCTPILGEGVTFLGHFAVLAVTLGIFVGTLTLNKVRASSSETDAANVDPK